MVNWTSAIAIHPFDPVAQTLPEPSKWKEYKGGQNFFVQILRARDVLSMRKCAEPNSGSSSKKVKMHSAMYNNPVPLGHQGRVKLRRSERRPISVKSDVLVQAEVPQWTGVVYESDSKWLGTQVWPVKDDSKPTTETDLVGRGRRGKCSYNVQGSVDCVRLHIAANRTKLKLELGSAFYHWGFDKMGEEVSLRWTADEEKRFKDAMRLKIPSQNKSFWNNPSIYFRRKTRKDMVSYCFNVYLIQLRSYRNRVNPKTVDCNNEEVEFGSFGYGFGMKAIKHPSMEFMEYSENTQCFDFE
ncbi:hypothetical protein MtrunA17_Chr8g0387161 [Medicago truncatula]|nr:AT-rich interactive domain-containing protein 2 [Medicago truncatula]XP_024629621.1 AT-rich interactive domain-containing protein 2 [Medicago truncatula]XP_024629622.1 AT-rich interactive domain-containing protein 2 [Medicago truncatula]XP_024629623.1 AT-rich interactive domain-containing protein 2 [Medicago truncatula]XP_039685250.1 AT-rich interactive domain-containing protein 2 [Medicago truncatula]XP_039685251.1 AT-rich interactive domain-containing protein 2 [Medicago truncatula]XP_03